MSMSARMYKYIGEILGCFILVFIGNSVLAGAVFTGGALGFTIVPWGWAIGTLAAIYIVGGISGGHLHPGITIALAMTKRMEKKDVLPYIISQIVGSFLGAAAVFVTRFGNWVVVDAAKTKITSAVMLFCQYPNPLFWGDYYPTDIGGTGALVAEVNTVFPAWMGILIEFLIGGVLLMLLVMAVLDSDSPFSLSSVAPYIIGIFVFAGVSIMGPLTMAGITPIRDFGPRLFAWVIGYGSLAFPGARGFEWTIYWIGPVIGAIVGVLIYDYLLKPFYKIQKQAKNK